jgi:NADH dehydrogenase (ubiquinone) 1 alpha subcomplex subunit 9
MLKSKRPVRQLLSRGYAYQTPNSFSDQYNNPHSRARIATVFGATGFVGSYMCALLAEAGWTLIVPWRKDELQTRDHVAMGDPGQINRMRFHPKYYDTILDVVSRSNIVINCAGRNVDKYGDTMIGANIKFAEDVAKACVDSNIHRHFYISNLNADGEHPSNYLKTKSLGEDSVRKILPSTTILKCADVFGPEDRLYNFYAGCIRFSIGAPMILSGQAKIQPLYVGDIGRGVLAALKSNTTEGKTYHLAGPEEFKMNQVIEYIHQTIEEDHATVRMPTSIGYLTGLVNEYTWKPVWTRDLVTRLQYDNVMPPDAKYTFKDLGLQDTLTRVDEEAPSYLAKWKRRADYFLDVHKKH